MRGPLSLAGLCWLIRRKATFQTPGQTSPTRPNIYKYFFGDFLLHVRIGLCNALFGHISIFGNTVLSYLKNSTF